MTENEISKILVDVFIKVHSQLGPGLLESVYEMAICYELTKRGINHKKQQGINVYYDDIKLDIGFRADIIVEDKIIVELKSIEQTVNFIKQKHREAFFIDVRFYSVLNDFKNNLCNKE